MKNMNGFGLTESMVVISIAGILITVGTPSLKSLSEYIRADSQIRKIQQSLVFARNQAISYSARVTVCALVDDSCSDDWSQGYSIFIDRDLVNTFDNKDILLFKSTAFNAKDIVTYNRKAVRFQPEGLASGTNGTLKYCPGDILNDSSRAVIINQSGRVRFSKKKNISCG